MKRKGLLEHLMRTSSQGELCNPSRRHSQAGGMRRSKTQLDSLTALRKKETIIQSGAYERTSVAPPKGRGKRVQKISYGHAINTALRHLADGHLTFI